MNLGRITREDYHDGLAAQKTTHAGKRLGEVLVAMVAHEGPERNIRKALALLAGSPSFTDRPLAMQILA